jgi:hypothetical protein
LQNDKSFAAYALILIAGVTSVLTASVLAGFARLPSPQVFLEHVALGLLMRASYKSIAGWNWADWTLTSGRAADATATAGFSSSDATAGAEG